MNKKTNNILGLIFFFMIIIGLQISLNKFYIISTFILLIFCIFLLNNYLENDNNKRLNN